MGDRMGDRMGDDQQAAWEGVLGSWRELANLLDEVDELLELAGRRDLADSLFRVSADLSLRLGYVAPRDIVGALAAADRAADND